MLQFTLICLSILSVSVAEHPCPVGKVIARCGKSCPVTCSDPPKQMCKTECSPGCYCRLGTFPNKYGKCIIPELCKETENKCPADKIYNECGSQCPPACVDSGYTNCTSDCVPGCFCPPGLVANTEGKCVTPDSCLVAVLDLCLPVNKIYSICGSRCPATCRNPHKTCKDGCARGCFCQSGQLLNRKRVCVTPDNCTDADICLQQHEVYNKCGTNCEPTCSEKAPTCDKACKVGCFCKDGYIRDSDDICIPKDKC